MMLFIVAGGAGTVDTGVVGIRANFTSITDGGVRTTSDSEVITADITTLSTNDYLEVSKKTLGEITFELYVVSGTPTAYSLDFNFGLCKYEDFGNKDFMIKGFECVGLAGANDTNFNIILLKHTNIGWTYAATGFTPDNDTICDMNTDHGTEQNLINGEGFAYKRVSLNTPIVGSQSEGLIIQLDCGANNSVQSMDIHIGVVF